MASEASDKITFEYCTIPRTKAGALAYGKVASDFVHLFRTSPHYGTLLLALFERLLEAHDVISAAAVMKLDEQLVEQLNTLLKAERDSDKSRKAKWAPMAPRRAHIDESSEEEELDPEEAAARAERERLEQERLEEEWRKSNERYEALQRQREENEAKLRAKARQVDTSALEKKLQEGIVLLNAGNAKPKKGGAKQQQTQNLSDEDLTRLLRDVAETVKCKERIKFVLQLGDDELPAQVTEARKEVAALEAQLHAVGGSPAVKLPSLNKGQIVQLQQKLSKQGLERDRLALQLKAMEPSTLRDELLEVLQQRDSIAVQLDLAKE